MKKFAVFDIDGTLIRWQLYHAIVSSLADRGGLSNNSHDQIRTAQRKWKERALSFSEYESALVREFLPMLPRLDPEQYEQAINDVWSEYRDQTYVYTRDLIKELRSKNYFLLIISGSPIEIIKPLAEYYGFSDFAACVFERDKNGHFTGKVTSPVRNKKLALRNLVNRHGLDWQGSIGVGDGGLDVAMLELVERPIAFNPDQKLYDAARERDWQIVVERKDVVYDFSCNRRLPNFPI